MGRKVRAKRARLVDVARLAGVSLGSASKALNDPEAVRPATLAAVRAAADQLAYVPDGTARALAMRRSQMIGVVLPTISNPVYAGFVHALQRSLIADGYHLVVLSHEYNPAAELIYIERLVQRGIDGLVLVGTDHDPQVGQLLARTRLPHVFSWSTDEAVAHECVGFSNRRAMQQLVGYLLELGHCSFAVISGATENNERARARLKGVYEALNLAGVELPIDNVIFTDLSVEGGRIGLRRTLLLEPRPTAVICSTDVVAAGALVEACANGVRIPQDLSITGFDDIELASLLNPPLTTVHAPIEEMGESVGRYILKKVESDEPLPSIDIPTYLVIRGSSVSPANARHNRTRLDA